MHMYIDRYPSALLFRHPSLFFLASSHSTHVYASLSYLYCKAHILPLAFVLFKESCLLGMISVLSFSCKSSFHAPPSSILVSVSAFLGTVSSLFVFTVGAVSPFGTQIGSFSVCWAGADVGRGGAGCSPSSRLTVGSSSSCLVVDASLFRKGVGEEEGGRVMGSGEGDSPSAISFRTGAFDGSTGGSGCIGTIAIVLAGPGEDAEGSIARVSRVLLSALSFDVVVDVDDRVVVLSRNEALDSISSEEEQRRSRRSSCSFVLTVSSPRTPSLCSWGIRF